MNNNLQQIEKTLQELMDICLSCTDDEFKEIRRMWKQMTANNNYKMRKIMTIFFEEVSIARKILKSGHVSGFETEVAERLKK